MWKPKVGAEVLGDGDNNRFSEFLVVCEDGLVVGLNVFESNVDSGG